MCVYCQVIAYDAGQTIIGQLTMAKGGPEWLKIPLRATGMVNLSIRPYVFDGRAAAVLPRVRLGGEDVAGNLQIA